MEQPNCCIVGMGPGLAMSVARRFGAEGFRVAMLSRSAAALGGFRKTLADAGVEAWSFPADAGSAESLDAASRQMEKKVGGPDVLVYNAAVIRQLGPTQLHPAVLTQDFQVNVTGALLATQHVVPTMRQQGRGTVLLTGGGLALEPLPDYTALTVGKAGLRALALVLAEELEPAGIHVATVTICGFIQHGTHFDPDRIAEVYWRLHCQEKGAWEREVIYR